MKYSLESLEMAFFFFCVCDLRVLVRELANPFVHPTQVSRQVKLVATCVYLRVTSTQFLGQERRDFSDLLVWGEYADRV